MIDPLVIKFYQKNPSPMDIKEIVDEIYTTIEKSCVAMDVILDKINVNRLDDVIIVAILRSTFPWKNDLKYWNKFLARATQNFTKTDKLHLLKGLKEE